MTINQALQDLANGETGKALEIVAESVARVSLRGQWYSGENSTHVSDWLEDGDIDVNDTIVSLAAEWDE